MSFESEDKPIFASYTFWNKEIHLTDEFLNKQIKHEFKVFGDALGIYGKLGTTILEACPQTLGEAERIREQNLIQSKKRIK